MVYTYYDYLENYYESYYEHQYANYNDSNTLNTSYNDTYEYHAPYNMKVLTPPTLTVILICTFLSVFIAIITIYKICNSPRRNKIIVGLTLFSICAHVAQNIIDPISYYLWYIDYDPHSSRAIYIYMLWDIAWCLAKLSLYIIFIYRYWLVFKETPAVDTKEKYIIFGSFIGAMLTQCTLSVVYLLYGYVVNYETNAERTYLNMCWAFLVLDTILICILACLLCRSVLKLVISIRKLGSEYHITTIAVTNNKETDDDPAAGCTELVTNYTESEYQTKCTQLTPTSTADKCMSPSSTADTTPKIADTLTTIPVYVRRITFASETRTVDHVVSRKSDTTQHEKRLNRFLHTATRIAVTMCVAMLSSFFYQFIWLLAEETDNHHMLWITFTWCIDAVVNMLCVYLSLSVAKQHYKCLCSRMCKLHQCILYCIEKTVDIQTN